MQRKLLFHRVLTISYKITTVLHSAKLSFELPYLPFDWSAGYINLRRINFGQLKSLKSSCNLFISILHKKKKIRYFTYQFCFALLFSSPISSIFAAIFSAISCAIFDSDLCFLTGPLSLLFKVKAFNVFDIRALWWVWTYHYGNSLFINQWRQQRSPHFQRLIQISSSKNSTAPW